MSDPTKPGVELDGVTERASNWFDELRCHPPVAKQFGRFGGSLLNGRLPLVDREVLVLRTAWLARCEYEWRHHVPVAVDGGLHRDAIRMIGSDDVSELASPHRLLVTAADQLSAECVLEDDVVRLLSSTYEADQVLEVLFIVGFYRMIAGAMRSLSVPVEEPYLDGDLPVGWFSDDV